MLNKTKYTDQTLPLECGQYYHIFNRGNNKELIFFNPGNYMHFLKLYRKYLADYIDTYAYCLIPNHFHLLIKVKDLEYFDRFNADKELNTMSIEEKLALEQKASKVVSEKFRVFLMSYTKGVNKQVGREGSLFRARFRRKLIDSEGYLLRLIGYIHANPVHHRMRYKIEDYPYSSYQTLVGEGRTLLIRQDVIDWFGGVEAFVQSHHAIEDRLSEEEFWME